jgi:signal transduction histidine kinase/DNA-binding response OmpR family regulator
LPGAPVERFAVAAPGPAALAPGESAPGTGELSLDRLSRPVRKRQTGRLSPEIAAEADAARLAVTAPQSADQVSPFEPAPLIATWGPATAYVDSGDAIQPLTLDSPEAIREPVVQGGRLLVPIRVADEVMGVLAFEGAEAGRPWTEADVEMALAVSQQLGVTLQDARSAQLTQQALDEMREADRLKTQFLANMSHELRTPLNSIIGFSRVILKGIDGPVNETQEQDLRAIHGAGLHLLGLINDILDVSKIEAGKMELTFGEVDLTEIVRGVMSTAVALVKDKPIDLRTEIAPDLPLIQADSIRVRQILLNLVSNAAKFTDTGYILVEARPIDEGGEREVLISVEDTGPGIALTDQAKLFTPFSQVDASPTRKTGGTGLGLSICRHLVELHGGSIWVESTPGEGSIFYFTLPVEQALPEPEGEEAPLILAVDDNPSVLARYRSSLESLGYRFQALPQADGVVELATQLQPGVMVIDPHLPSQAAWNLIQGLRASPVTRMIPVVLGSFAPENGRAFRLHAADVMLKPVTGHGLGAALKRLLPRNPSTTLGAGPSTEAAAEKPSPFIVVVDDESSESTMLRTDLAEAGPFRVETASSGTALYQTARREAPDAVILNLFMARAEGFRALEVVRKDPVLRAVPLILVASSQPHNEERRQLALYTEYLQRQGTATEADYLAEVRGLVQAYAPLP